MNFYKRTMNINPVKRNIPKPTFFGKNLKYLRSLKKMSQLQLAEDLSIKRNNVASYENGIVEPNAERLLVFSKYFNIAPEVLTDIELVTEKNKLNTNDINKSYKQIRDLKTQLTDLYSSTEQAKKVQRGYSMVYDELKSSITQQESQGVLSSLTDFLHLLKNIINNNYNFIQEFSENKSSNKLQ